MTTNRSLKKRSRTVKLAFLAMMLSLIVGGCTVVTEPPAPDPAAERVPDVRQVDPAQAKRLHQIMTPLLKVMDRPRTPKEVRIGIIESPEINAASGGGGEFFVTTGLLEKANDRQLRGIMAHEIAHDDLGHVARAQVRGAGLQIGAILLEQLFPGTGAITPIAGTLIARGYSRSDELAADKHGAELLRRAGQSKDDLVDALTWIAQQPGARGGGGFLATHPAIEDRIAELKR